MKNNIEKWEDKIRGLKLNKTDLNRIEESVYDAEIYGGGISCPWGELMKPKCHVCLTVFPKTGPMIDGEISCPCSIYDKNYVSRVMKKVIGYHKEEK